MKFSKTKQAFYPDDMLADYAAAGSLPGDLEDFPDRSFQDLMTAKTAGKIFDWSGSVPVAVDAPPAVPEIPSSVSPAQARLALHGAGLLAQVEAIVAAADVPTQIAWNNASVIERTSPTVAALAGALGLTDAQLDDLFTTAAGIFV
jgi:hypothetical protein